MKLFTKFLLISICCLFLQAANASNPLIKGSESPKNSLKLKRDMCKGGFYFNFGLFKPTKKYLLESDEEWPDAVKFGLGESFEIGNMIRIADLDNKAIGIRATWLNVNYSNIKIDNEISNYILHISVFKVGPYFSFGMGDKMAIDIYYQIAPQYIMNYVIHPIEGDHSTYNYIGFANSAGLAYRFSILQVGFDTNFGKANYIVQSDDPTDFKMKPRFPYLRFYVGLKF